MFIFKNEPNIIMISCVNTWIIAKDIGQELSQIIMNPFNARGSPGLSLLRIAECLWLTLAIMHNAFSRGAALPSKLHRLSSRYEIASVMQLIGID